MTDKIIQDILQLQDISNITPCDSLEEGKLLAEEMFKILVEQKTAPVLSGNQVGIMKNIIVMSIREPIYLVNPKIKSMDILAPHLESHASFPQKLFTTLRYASILVTADNIDGEFRFGLKKNQRNLLYKNHKVNIAVTTHPIVMEAAYIQQAIDTLNGILPMERDINAIKITAPISVDKQPGRNEIVVLERLNPETHVVDEMNIKFKFIDKYLIEGWTMK